MHLVVDFFFLRQLTSESNYGYKRHRQAGLVITLPTRAIFNMRQKLNIWRPRLNVPLGERCVWTIFSSPTLLACSAEYLTRNALCSLNRRGWRLGNITLSVLIRPAGISLSITKRAISRISKSWKEMYSQSNVCFPSLEEAKSAKTDVASASKRLAFFVFCLSFLTATVVSRRILSNLLFFVCGLANIQIHKREEGLVCCRHLFLRMRYRWTHAPLPTFPNDPKHHDVCHMWKRRPYQRGASSDLSQRCSSAPDAHPNCSRTSG